MGQGLFRAVSRAVISLLLSGASLASAEQWKNPADRYAEAYIPYQDEMCPIGQDAISHFVYFARDRGRMRGHSFLDHSRFVGAQIMYRWRDLEPKKGKYDFSKIRSDLNYLRDRDKTLFIQLQDVTFSAKHKPVPDYILNDDYAGGVVPYRTNDRTIGWISRRWDPRVQDRFAALVTALGEEFDGEIEGINLQESAIDVAQNLDPTFTPTKYAEALKANMSVLKQAFPNSITMQYANFMPGEWLPWEDEGFLRGIYAHGEATGVGLGAPDLMVKRRAQLNHPIAMMHEGIYSVPLGIAIQDGNYVGRTGADEHFTNRAQADAEPTSMVPMLHAFAQDFLNVDYMFWVDQAPYFEAQVMPCFLED